MDLGREVESCLGTMVEALETHDVEIAREVFGVDATYKERGAQIAEECLILQARQAPVARDLRLIYTVQTVQNHLVRAGTLCEYICQAVAESADAERDPDLETALLEMCRGAYNLFRQGFDIFEARDIDRARDLEAADDKIDLLYPEAMNLAFNPGKDGGSPEWRAWAALTVHYLERIADHGVGSASAPCSSSPASAWRAPYASTATSSWTNTTTRSSFSG
jgi:phosphate transport system protein